MEWLGLESELGSGLQQGHAGYDWTCSKETETLCGWEWGRVWSPSLFGRHVRCQIKVGDTVQPVSAGNILTNILVTDPNTMFEKLITVHSH